MYSCEPAWSYDGFVRGNLQDLGRPQDHIDPEMSSLVQLRIEPEYAIPVQGM
jgi:hypothetical protein